MFPNVIVSVVVHLLPLDKKSGLPILGNLAGDRRSKTVVNRVSRIEETGRGSGIFLEFPRGFGY